MTGIRAERVKHDTPARPPRWGLGRRLSGGHLAMLLAGLIAAAANYALLRGDGATVTVLVAARDVTVGEVITAGSIRPASLRIDEDLAARLLRPDEAADYVGAVAAAPLAAGDPVRRSDLRPAAAGTGGLRSMSIPVERAHAAGGHIDPGDRVDVVAVRDGTARYVLAGAQVLAVTRGGEGALEGLDRFAVTVAVDGHGALCVAEALATGGVEVLVSTGAEPVEATACAGAGVR